MQLSFLNTLLYHITKCSFNFNKWTILFDFGWEESLLKVYKQTTNELLLSQCDFCLCAKLHCVKLQGAIVMSLSLQTDLSPDHWQ